MKTDWTAVTWCPEHNPRPIRPKDEDRLQLLAMQLVWAYFIDLPEVRSEVGSLETISEANECIDRVSHRFGHACCYLGDDLVDKARREAEKVIHWGAPYNYSADLQPTGF